MKTIKNKFQRDMVNSVTSLTRNFKIKNITHLHLMPLWYNSGLEFEFRKRWKNKGYFMVGDKLNKNGEIFPKEECIEKDLQINFQVISQLNQKSMVSSN